MALIKTPDLAACSLSCALCGVGLSLDKATAGMLKADKTQAYACISHFWEVELLVVRWADFLAHQRREYVLSHDNPIDTVFGGGNVWFDS